MKGIYLAAGKARHENYDIIYQDVNGKRDIGGDMMGIDLTHYDFIIATPPCNYWSRCNYRREISDYAQKTKYLLPSIIDKCIEINKPFIVENVRNNRLFGLYGLLSKNCKIVVIGRHTYWTNIEFKYDDIEQRQDFRYGGKTIKYDDMESKYHQGGFNVYNVIERFLLTLMERK